MREIRWETESRYYAARVSQDLLGAWIVERAWGGRFNDKGNHTQQVAPSYPDAVQEMIRISQERRVRRYGIVKSQ